MRFILPLILCLVLTGCASTMTVYEWDIKTKKWIPKVKVETKGNAKTKVGADGSIEQDSRNEPLVKMEVPLTKLGGK